MYLAQRLFALCVSTLSSSSKQPEDSYCLQKFVVFEDRHLFIDKTNYSGSKRLPRSKHPASWFLCAACIPSVPVGEFTRHEWWTPRPKSNGRRRVAKSWMNGKERNK